MLITLLAWFPSVSPVLQEQPDPARITAWRRDLEQVVRDIRALHPSPFRKTGELTFLRHARALQDDLPRLSEEERMVRAMALVALIGDGHTQLAPDDPAYASWYPVRLYEFTDGCFVTSAHASVAELAGVQVLRIAGKPVAEVLGAARRLHGADNGFDALERLYAVHSAGLMKGLGYARPGGELDMTFRLRDGAEVEHTLVPQRADGKRTMRDDSSFEWHFEREMFGPPFGGEDEWVSAFVELPASAYRRLDLERPLHLALRAPYFRRDLPEAEAYYAQFNQVDDHSLLPFVRDMLREVERATPRRLIIDLRFNFGGDSSKAMEIVNEFVARQAARSWGELYLLTGRKTFSAAVLLLDEFLDHLPCTVVGEPSGSPANMHGDSTERRYGVGLRLDVSTRWHQHGASEDLGEFVPVDVPALPSFEDYVNGADAALDAILLGEEMRSVPIIARADGAAAARKVYLERKRRFAQHAWLTPPSEIALRFVADEQQRAEALETCRLNTEIHPDVWNTWYNLGNAQDALGLQREACESYRRVLALDPHNFNGADLRAYLARHESLR